MAANNSINISTLAHGHPIARQMSVGHIHGSDQVRRGENSTTRRASSSTRQSVTVDNLIVVEFACASERASERAREIDNHERKRIHKFRVAARVRLYENYKAINYDRDKLSSRGAIIEREPR